MSMIAARQIFDDNPYVTDGLVAMWDAEWNTGFLKHDPASIVWKDLVGSSDMTAAAGIDYRKNQFILGWHNGKQHWFSCSSSHAIVDVVNSRSFTIEVVYGDVVTGQASAGPFGLGENNDAFSMQQNMAVNDVFNFRCFSQMFSVEVSGREDHVFQGNCRVIFGVQTDQMFIWHNSQMHFKKTVFDTADIDVTAVATIGKSGINSNAVYGVRRICVYNHVLSEHEIIRNGNADKARFGV